MKTKLSLCFALLAVTAAQAQIFRSEAVNGAILGGIAGGIIGHQSGGNNGWQGAALGATAGLLIGQAVGDANAQRDRTHYGPAYAGYVYRSSPSVHIGVGYGHYGHSGHYGHRYGHYGYRGYRDYSWGISYRPSYSYYGGYAGYPYGGYSGGYDYVYRPATPVVIQQPQPVVVSAPQAPAAQPAPQQVTIINNYYNNSTPMSSANGLFGR